ncbi:MAG: isoaspartyl peptidase/L-asparaginase family protein [Methylocystis sp.]
MSDFSLMIHGGAGAVREPERFEGALRRIITRGAEVLASDGAALEAVTLCVQLLEDDPLFNAGFGSVLNAQGIAECDAAIMDGRSLSAGAVAGVGCIKNPILLARAIMEKSDHVFLIAPGAEEFARAQGVCCVPTSYFQTQERLAQLARAKERAATALDHDAEATKKLGTVGAVARDKKGNLAAATSTGGMTNKSFGRVGDSAVIGAGVFADNASCAVSCTGVGEHFLRMSPARTVAFLIEDLAMDTKKATNEAQRRLETKIQGVGGMIVVGKDGVCARAKNTPSLLSATAYGGTISIQLA